MINILSFTLIVGFGGALATNCRHVYITFVRRIGQRFMIGQVSRSDKKAMLGRQSAAVYTDFTTQLQIRAIRSRGGFVRKYRHKALYVEISKHPGLISQEMTKHKECHKIRGKRTEKFGVNLINFNELPRRFRE